jgi:uncharacterized phage protein (TIGR02218 family)
MTEPWLIGPVMTSAYGWRLERRDGVTLGFTSHDHDVVIGGLKYQASPGMQPTSITESIGIEADGLEVSGAINASAIREDDLNAGRWDNARLTIFLFDWTSPQSEIRILAEGEWGEVSFSDVGFETELRGLTAFLDTPVVPQTSPGCRANFCGQDCGLNAQRFQHLARINAVDGVSFDFDSLQIVGGANAFAYGSVRWIGGANIGLAGQILNSDAGTFVLASKPAFAVTAGTLVQIFEGCDKTIATCSTRFGNAINFRGEPFLPGNDLLTRYPGAS